MEEPKNRCPDAHHGHKKERVCWSCLDWNIGWCEFEVILRAGTRVKSSLSPWIWNSRLWLAQRYVWKGPKHKACGGRGTYRSPDLIFKEHLLQFRVAHANNWARSDPSSLLSPCKVTSGVLVWSCAPWRHEHSGEGPKKGHKEDDITEAAHIWGKIEVAQPAQPGEEKTKEGSY